MKKTSLVVFVNTMVKPKIGTHNQDINQATNQGKNSLPFFPMLAEKIPVFKYLTTLSGE